MFNLSFAQCLMLCFWLTFLSPHKVKLNTAAQYKSFRPKYTNYFKYPLNLFFYIETELSVILAAIELTFVSKFTLRFFVKKRFTTSFRLSFQNDINSCYKALELLLSLFEATWKLALNQPWKTLSRLPRDRLLFSFLSSGYFNLAGSDSIKCFP